jgi:hypothetical protein
MTAYVSLFHSVFFVPYFSAVSCFPDLTITKNCIALSVPVERWAQL